MTATEASAVSDGPIVSTGVDPYGVEFDGVVEATVVTTDKASRPDANGNNCDTFTRVNDFPGSYDLSKFPATFCSPAPEISAHLLIAGAGATPGYADDNLATNATFRLRGSSSRLASQKSYRIKLASGRPLWRGEGTLQFNKHPYDLTRMRNKLAMDLFRDIPHMGSLRTQFVRMSILNKDATGTAYAGQSAPVDFGLFTHVEKFGKEFLTNRGLPTDGNIYKSENFDFSPGARDALALALDSAYRVIAASKPNFEAILSLEADNNNHLPLIDMLNDINNDAIPFDTTFEKYFEKANYLTWLATSILMGNRDTVNQNFALYQPKAGTKFYFLPWDYDGAFGFEDQPNEAAARPLYAQWQKTAANWWGVSLHRRFMQDPKHMAELQLAVSEIYSAYLTQNKIKAKTDHYKTLIETRVTAAPDLARLTLLPGSPDAGATQWARESDRLATAVTTNHNNFAGGLEAPMLQTSAFLRVTRDWRATRRVLNISSVLGRRPMASQAAYCAAKAGMDQFTRCAALDEAQKAHGAKLCSLAPGVIDTDMQVQLRSTDPALFPDAENFAQMKTTGSLATPEAAAARVLEWLAREDFGQQPVADVRDA